MWKIEDFCETQTSRKVNSKMKFKTCQLEWKFTVVSNQKTKFNDAAAAAWAGGNNDTEQLLGGGLKLPETV